MLLEVVDPGICHGKACMKGTRIPVSVILDNLAAGPSLDQVLRSYPNRSRAVPLAVGLAREQVVAIPA